MSYFHRTPLEMAWLRLCRITNESTEIENCYSSFNRVALAVELSIFVIFVVSFLVFASDYTSSWPLLTFTFNKINQLKTSVLPVYKGVRNNKTTYCLYKSNFYFRVFLLSNHQSINKVVNYNVLLNP